MLIPKTFFRTLSLFFILSFCNQCNMDPGKIPVTVLGLDGSGKEFHHVIPGKQSKHLGRSLDDISEESLGVLDKHWENSPWALDRIDIGLGLTFKLGFAVIDFSVNSAVRLTFKKK